MSAPELLARATALRQAPPVPSNWAATVGDALAEQAVLAEALAPLRVEFDKNQWQHLGALVIEGLEPDHAAALARAAITS